MRPEMADLRVRLEGKLEVLEAALARYRVVNTCLENPETWLAESRLHFDSVQEVSRRFREIQSAIEKVEAVMRRDRWDPDIEAAQLVERVRLAQREANARLRAVLIATPPRAETLESRLEKLALLSDLVRVPREGETALAEGVVNLPFEWSLANRLVIGIGGAAFIVAVCLGQALLSTVVVLLVTIIAVWQSQKHGTFWLGTDRLIWTPYEGERVEVPVSELAENPEERLRALFGNGSLSANSRQLLESLILLYGRGPLKGRTQPVDPRTILLDATSIGAGAPVWGSLLIAGRRVLFVPYAQAAALTHALTGASVTEPLLTHRLLDELRRLDPDRLGEVLPTLRSVPGVVIATDNEVTGELITEMPRLLRLKTGSALLEVKLTLEEQYLVQRHAPWITPQRG